VDGTSLRKERPEDEAFLIALYTSTRETELAGVPWTDAQKAEFLRSQFALQRSHYRTYYHDSDFCIIEADGKPIGRLYVHRSAREIRLMDIALLPAWRGRGIGGAYLQALLRKAQAANLPVTLHVEPGNPARRLYLRTGFRRAAELGLYQQLVWLPPKPAGEYEAAEPAQQQQDGGRLRDRGAGRSGVDRQSGEIEAKQDEVGRSEHANTLALQPEGEDR
jgi:GNAT superfamily N-acetyltransferase